MLMLSCRRQSWMTYLRGWSDYLTGSDVRHNIFMHAFWRDYAARSSIIEEAAGL
jgi:hypothetical protein